MRDRPAQLGSRRWEMVAVGLLALSVAFLPRDGPLEGRAVSAVAAGPVLDSVRISVSVPEGDYYTWATHMQAGPFGRIDVPQEAPFRAPRAYRHRAVVTTAEIYSGLYLERVTYGSEGCCAEVTWRRQVDLRELATAYGIRGEISGLRVQGFSYDNAVIVILKERRFELLILGDDEVWVREHAPLRTPGPPQRG